METQNPSIASESVTAPAVRKKKAKSYGGKPLRTMDKVFIVTMLFIPIVHFLIFWVYVNFNSIMMAFQLPTGEWSWATMESVFLNFSEGMENSSLLISIQNTLIYFFKDLLMMPFQVLVAYFLFRKIIGHKAIQVILYMPALISGVVITSAFSSFINPSGPIGTLLTAMGMEAPEFLANSDYATGTILFYTIWLGWSGNMLLLGGAMARIPVEILESARLDGITTPKEIVYMVFPLIWNTLSTLIILQMTGIFGAGGPVLLFTQGRYKTSTIGWWIFEKINYTGASAYNEVSAAGLVLTCVGVPIILTVRKLIEKIPSVDY
ncbi:MAG: sugar ABC transporter permease [Clostridia bacterium]|nr:sugar ABC transporter permease [Clostridia bacterium]